MEEHSYLRGLQRRKPTTIKSYIKSGVSKYYVKSDHRLDEIIADITLFLDHPGKIKKVVSVA